mmetsp:Transcript_15925/g.53290  ORF Transcript_15925/g.53290 Transcript_15925/m.53290 type:complete len:341 (+) Transcript_15925:3190-4212(+)
MAAGKAHVVLIFEDGEVSTCGKNDHGELGQGHICDCSPAMVSSLLQQTVLRASDVQSYCFSEHAQPQPVHLTGKGAVQVACGDRHTLVLFENGEVHGWGDTRKGQLGKGKEEYVVTPACISFDPHCWKDMNIAQIACGSEFSFFISRKGHVFVCGDNSCGQLGLPLVVDTARIEVERPIAASHETGGGGGGGGDFLQELVKIRMGKKSPGLLESNLDENKNHILVPVEVPALLQHERITRVICGSQHTLVCVEREDRCYEVWAFGDNKFGQLGQGKMMKKTNVPVRVVLPHPIVHVACGAFHSMVIDNQGNVYGWGRNHVGQLGTGLKLLIVVPLMGRGE